MRLACALVATLALAACRGPLPPASATPPEPAPAAPALSADPVPGCPADAGVMDGWDDRAPPRKVFGNVYYVGTCGITALLVTSPQGHVLLDGATAAAGPAIVANIRALGFDPAAIRFIVNSHEHSDHAGGLAHLQAASAARVLARAPAVATLERGTGDRDDPQSGVLDHFPPLDAVQPLADGQVVRVGDLALTAHATPGHAPGGTSWTWVSCQDGRCLDLAYADSLTAAADAHYRFSDHPAYLAAFGRSIDAVASLPCDILLTPHPLASNLFARMDGTAALVDRDACRRYAAAARDRLDRRLADEAAATPAAAGPHGHDPHPETAR